MVEYCQHCGKQRTGGVCHYCGHRYETKRIDTVKHEMKRHLRKTRMHFPPLLSLVIFAVIFALVVVLAILLISPSSFQNKNVQITLNSIVNPNNKMTGNTIITTANSQQNSAGNTKPQLRVYHQMVNQIGGSIGCFGRVDGGVTNSGSADAQNVIVTCTAEEYSVQKDIGTVKASNTNTFQVLIDYDCSHPRQEECTVTCSNC